MKSAGLERILSSACRNFIDKIDKFELVYESDLRYAVYAEMLKAMDARRIERYPIRTEHKYGDSAADFSLGENHEIAVEFKFTFAYIPPSPVSALRAGKEQLEQYLKNGAGRALLIYLDVPPGERDSASKLVHLEDFGLSGKWTEICMHANFED